LGCASKRTAGIAPEPPPEPPAVEEVAPPPEPPPDLDAVYARLDRSRELYEEGIDLIVEGEEVLGERRIVEASNAMHAGAEECIETPGCDMERYFRAFDHLLTAQNIALKKQGTRIDELESSAAADLEREPGTSPFAATIPEVDRTVSLLHGTELRDIITLNGPVNAALDDWLTWMRPLLMEAYVNYQFLRPSMAPVYEEAGLPEALLFAMVVTESGGKVHSFSRAGAAGPLQFMRSTGRKYGLTMRGGFDTRLDPEEATRANVAYLNDQFAELNNSLEKALAAYNGGENRVKGLHRRLGGASLWDGRMYYSLPRETREYVPRILAASWLFLHAEEYNLEFPVLEYDTTHLALRDAISVGELTICLGQAHNPDGWFRTLRNLNPRLNPGDRVEAGQEIVVPTVVVPVYEERCLSGELLERARRLHDANYPEEPAMIPYVVRRGDTLGKIAARHSCVSIGELAEINRIRPPRYVIRVGQQLRIPTCG
jgi:membrane-bound lytic murein transglycosylase D